VDSSVHHPLAVGKVLRFRLANSSFPLQTHRVERPLHLLTAVDSHPAAVGSHLSRKASSVNRPIVTVATVSARAYSEA
jgi:hypothetical protein